MRAKLTGFTLGVMVACATLSFAQDPPDPSDPDLGFPSCCPTCHQSTSQAQCRERCRQGCSNYPEFVLNKCYQGCFQFE